MFYSINLRHVCFFIANQISSNLCIFGQLSPKLKAGARVAQGRSESCSRQERELLRASGVLRRTSPNGSRDEIVTQKNISFKEKYQHFFTVNLE